MKTIIIFALAFVVLVTGEDGIEQVCEPGSTKSIECNGCFCIADGSGWACTQKGCHVGRIVVLNATATPLTENAQAQSEEEDRCEAESTKMIDCNSCHCVGGRWACTKIGCIH